MIEMLGVLAIIGVLSAGGIWAYSTAMENYKVNQTISDIQTMLSVARNIFIGKVDSNTVVISPKKMQDLGILPKKYEFIDPNCGYYDNYCRVKTLFGTKAVFFGATHPSYGFCLRVDIFDLPESACIKISKINWLPKASIINFRLSNSLTDKTYWITPDYSYTYEQLKTMCGGGARIYMELRSRK